MDRAARQADVIVPVIAGDTITDDTSYDEHIIRAEWKRKISSVLITKRDLIYSLNTFRRHVPTIVSKCQISDRQDCLLTCDTPKGMAAMRLQHLLDEIQRKYPKNSIPPEATAENNDCLKEEIAEVIAGITDDLNPFHRVSLCNTW